MISGSAFIITIKEEFRERFYNWAKAGNEKTAKGEMALMGLEINFYPIEEDKHILVMQHLLFFNFSWFLRLYFWFMAFRIRKGYSIKFASKIDLINYMGVKLWGKKK